MRRLPLLWQLGLKIFFLRTGTWIPARVPAVNRLPLITACNCFLWKESLSKKIKINWKLHWSWPQIKAPPYVSLNWLFVGQGSMGFLQEVLWVNAGGILERILSWYMKGGELGVGGGMDGLKQSILLRDLKQTISSKVESKEKGLFRRSGILAEPTHQSEDFQESSETAALSQSVAFQCLFKQQLGWTLSGLFPDH